MAGEHSPDFIMDVLKPKLVAMGFRDGLTRDQYKALGHGINYSCDPNQLLKSIKEKDSGQP